MKIYTKSGDKGETRIYAGNATTAAKNDAILSCYGDIDELNSHIGLLIAMTRQDDMLTAIQRNLFSVGFAISASCELKASEVEKLEAAIDTMTETLPRQNRFILPGGTQAAAQAHVCRAVCRRAERSLVTVANQHSVDSVPLAYLNRLSDYLFTLARYLNSADGNHDVFL